MSLFGSARPPLVCPALGNHPALMTRKSGQALKDSCRPSPWVLETGPEGTKPAQVLAESGGLIFAGRPRRQNRPCASLDSRTAAWACSTAGLHQGRAGPSTSPDAVHGKGSWGRALGRVMELKDAAGKK